MEIIVIFIGIVGAILLAKHQIKVYLAAEEIRQRTAYTLRDALPETRGWVRVRCCHDAWEKGSHKLILVKDANTYVFVAGNGYIARWRNTRGALEEIDLSIKNIEANIGPD